MAKRKNNKKKSGPYGKEKVGKYGEVVIPKFGSAVNALKHRYRGQFPDMTMYLHFNALEKNFIFQKIQSFPVERIQYRSESHTVEFYARWKGGGALGYMLNKPVFEIELREKAQTVGWDNVSSFQPQISHDTGKIKRNGRWKPFDDADDIIAETSINVDDVRSINMYDWGFELIGDMISLLAVNTNIKFPKFPKDISMSIANLSFGFGEEKDELAVRWSQPGYEPIRQTVPDFNKELFFMNDEKVEEPKSEIVVKNIGQRCMHNLDIED